MNIIEVKNNLVKIGYEEDLGLSNLILIKDSTKAYIAQVIHLESTRVGKSAIAKIVFCYDGQIRAYDGTLPAVKSETRLLPTSFIHDLISPENPLTLGKLAGSNDNIIVDFDSLNDNPIILSEKFYITKYLLNNLALQIKARNKKLVVFDTAGMFTTNKLTISKDFKLPLNCDLIDYICEKTFADATPESRAMIQAIFEEVSEYAKTVEFIPFDDFKSVVDAEFNRTKLMQLVILKNKLKQLRNLDIFAQVLSDLGNLQSKLENSPITVIDISKIGKSLQTETIKYVYTLLKSSGLEYYAITPLADEDRAVLTTISDTENVHTVIVCDYSYPNLADLKKVSKNMFMFTPIKQQKDFGGYNIFLQKLAEDEFIAYGKMTKFVPLITKLYQMSGADITVPAQAEIPAPTITKPKIEPVVEEIAEPQPTVQEEIPTEPTAEAEPIAEEPTPTAEPAENGIISDVAEPTVAEPQVELNSIEPQPIEEISTPTVDNTEADFNEGVTESQIAQMASGTVDEVIKTQEEPVSEPTQGGTELEQALSEVPDLQDEEELSDDDLDMIEQLSTPNEEIPALNPEAEPIAIQPEPAITEPAVEPEPVAQEVVQPEAIAEEPAEEIPAEEEEKPTTPPPTEPLQTRSSSTPSVPEYSAEIPNEDKVNSDAIKQGDKVFHEEFGEGVVEKMINYGDKILCSVNFANVGRRLLNPEITEMRRIG